MAEEEKEKRPVKEERRGGGRKRERIKSAKKKKRNNHFQGLQEPRKEWKPTVRTIFGDAKQREKEKTFYRYTKLFFHFVQKRVRSKEKAQEIHLYLRRKA